MDFLDYETYNQKLNELVKKDFPNPIKKEEPIAYTSCGFPVDHFKIGNGNKHITVMAGTHGTEIIGIDFVLKLMENIAKNKSLNKNFTIDFIPCQKPEGFIIVTMTLKKFIKDLEKDALKYYEAYKKDDINIIKINKIIKDKEKIKEFWDKYRFEKTNTQTLEKFLNKQIEEDIEIDKEKYHYKIFENLSYKDLPEVNENYKKLKDKLQKIMEKDYDGYKFPKQSIIDFRANASGVDLNKNNPQNLLVKKAELKEESILFGALRFNQIRREVPGPQGATCQNLEDFKFENENIGLLKHLTKLRKEEKYFGAYSFHGTGGIIYAKPLNYKQIEDKEKALKIKEIDDLNTKIAEEYEKITGYATVDYPQKLTGTGDMLRQMFPGFILIELSKMGGNPLGPYGDRQNYQKVIKDNINAFNKIIEITPNLNYNEHAKEMY